MDKGKSFDLNTRKIQYGKNNGHFETQIPKSNTRQELSERIDNLIRNIDLILMT